MINHILVVDDDARVLETFARNLALMGYHISTAADGETALARYAQTPPDLALVDIRMPGIDGLEVLRAVRERDPEAEIVIITGHGDMEIAIQALRLGASDFLSKPVDKLTLEATLQRAEARLSLKRRLQAEQTRFFWVVERAEVGYLILDAGDHIRYANSQARAYLGLAESAAAPPQTFQELAAARYTFQPEQDWRDWPCPPESTLKTCLYLVQPNVAGEDACWLRVDRAAMTTEDEPRYLVRIKDVSADIAGRSFVWTFERMIGHKLKDPLGQLTGFLQLLEADWPTLSPEAIAADLAEARHGAETLKERLMDIFAYLEAPGLGRGACLIATLPELVAQVKAGLQLESLALDVDVALPEGATLPLAPQAVELILWELCENARKFHPTHTPQINIAVAAAPEGLRLSVSDDGVHLTPEALHQLGTPYYQAESTFTADVPGMGLGLATVAALVWDVGGAFQARNRADRPGLRVELLFQ